MSTLFFSIPNHLTIRISSDKDLVFGHNEYLLLKGYIPGIVQLETQPEIIDLIIEHTESEDKKLIQEEGYVHIFDTWKGVLSADVYHLLYGIIRVQFLKRNLFPIHGACVGKDDHVLIVGHSGAGKTSVLLKLLENKDMKIFSGNKTVVSFGIDKPTAVAGTSTITIRGSGQGKISELNISDHVEYWGRYAFMLNPERYESREQVRIKAIVVIRLNDYAQESKEINSLSALHGLYPFFLDVVNADVVISDANDVFIGTVPKGIERYLVAQLKNALKNTSVYSIIGSSSFVANEILKL